MANRVCDTCLDCAYDNDVEDESQADVMAMLGADLEDHLCDQVETAGEIKCGCACRSQER